jgi:hypothetical protein
MPGLFGDFDFNLLDDPEFQEDSVRDELIVPLLAALGYSASPPYRIIRSRKLDHPYVYFGTVKKGISIIPDYLLERDGEYAWVLDAKAPSENIDVGKNVEQAYSYAMHRDIRVPLYGLCNGRKLVVFDVRVGPPIIDVPLREIEAIWPKVLGLLGCRSAWPHGLPPGYRPDFGLALAKAGLIEDQTGKRYFHLFMGLSICVASKLEDGLYTVAAVYEPENSQAFMLSFDFTSDVYTKFLAQLHPAVREAVSSALSRQPYQFAFAPEARPTMMIVGHVGDKSFTNDEESYRPFIAEDFVWGG